MLWRGNICLCLCGCVCLFARAVSPAVTGEVLLLFSIFILLQIHCLIPNSKPVGNLTLFGAIRPRSAFHKFISSIVEPRNSVRVLIFFFS